jgi:hypothetical protein
LHDQLLSPTGEFFDLNQETSTLFHGSLAAISTMGAAEVRMRAKRLMLAAVIALPMLAGHGAGQEIGQSGRGLVLAQRLCAECHAVQKEYSRSPNANAPRFQAIASIPGMTATALSAALNTSHRRCPTSCSQPTSRQTSSPLF